MYDNSVSYRDFLEALMMESKIRKVALGATRLLVVESLSKCPAMTVQQLAAALASQLSVPNSAELRQLVCDVVTSLCSETEILPVWCEHGKHDAFDGSCPDCGGAFRLAGSKPHSGAKVWEALCRSRGDGMTRDELAGRTNISLQTVCWRVQDLIQAGRACELSETRNTANGKPARIIIPR